MEEIYRVFLILFGLGMVIFVHELGHFLVARWSGVLVERFSIGFGPILFAFRRGETEYAVSAIPFGGYVKMLGQTDTPEVEEVVDDERSYQNQSVGKRMGIISAGVIMNVLFGFVCFAAAFRLGVPYQPAVIGSAMPAKPAWKEGLRAGDHIVEINGHRPTDYETLLNEVALTSPETEAVSLLVERNGNYRSMEISPVQEEMKPLIGVLPGEGLELISAPEATAPNSPARRAKPGFEPGDLVLAVNDESVQSHYEFAERMFAIQDQKATITVLRQAKQGSREQVDIEVEPNHVRTLGDIQMKIGDVAAVQEGSPAAKATDADGNHSPLMPRDIIVAIDGDEDIDPMRIPDVITAKAGEPVEITILRPGPQEQKLTLTVVPENVPTWIDFPDAPIYDEVWPVSIPSIGLAYNVLAVVRKAERPPGATEWLQAKDSVKKVEFTFETAGTARTVELDVKEEQWPSIFWALQFPEIRTVRLTVDRPGHPTPIHISVEPTPDETWPMRMRGLRFAYARGERQEETLAGAIGAGMDKTRTSVIRLYLFLRGLLVTRTISSKNLAGPIRITHFAYSVSVDPVLLILFLGMLNINLAVINFLPIPILDGGHMVFLCYELLLRRRPSDRIIQFANYLGLFVVLGLVVYVVGLDLIWLFRSVIG